jgi:uncharacterized protein (TIGR00290 family)
MIPILISWSGGKDAAFALHRLRQQGEYEPVALLTTVTDELERIAMHGIRREILLAQGRALGLPVIEARQPRFPDNASYEAGFAAALSQARSRWPALSHIAFGDLFLADVRRWREDLLARHAWQGVFPLWGEDTKALAGQMMQAGIDARLCCIDARSLAADFVGRHFDATLLRDLPDAVDPCCENGEFHTLVSNAPGFRARLRVEPGEQHRDEYGFEYLDFRLVET